MEEDIRAIKEYIEYDKEHRIVTVFDKKPLFRDRLENILNELKRLKTENELAKETIKNHCADMDKVNNILAKLQKDNEALEYQLKCLHAENNNITRELLARTNKLNELLGEGK